MVKKLVLMYEKNYVLLVAFVFLMMASCSDESLVPDSSATDRNLHSIVFTIAPPSAEPVTYAMEQDLNEYRIETLDVYEFDCDEIFSLDEAVLHAVYTADTEGYEWSDSQTGGSNGLRLVLKPDLADTGERIFLFVANAGCATNGGTAEDLTQLTSGSITMGAFIRKLTHELADEGPASPFVMTGFSEQIKIVHEMQYSGHIAMTRAVARIDLCTVLTNANDLLAITSITLKNVPKSSCLFPMPKLTKTETEITYENPSDALTYKTKTAAALDYTFETEDPNTAKTIANPNNGWITNGTIVDGKVSFDVAENTLGLSREGVIWIKSSKDTTGADAYGIKIVQQGETEVSQNGLLSFSSFFDRYVQNHREENSFLTIQVLGHRNKIIG